jgi:FkbM family methyltransferase
MIRGTTAKPRGLARWTNKLVKSAYRLIHQRLGIPAEGRMILDPDGRARDFRINLANTAYIDYVNRATEHGYEPDVTALFDAMAPAVNVVYDIGANWGYFVAVLVSNPGFAGRVHAFEIAPRTFRDLVRLVAALDVADRVTCHPFGLSETSGIARIEEGFHSALTRVSAAPSGTPVPVERLDGLAIADPDLIKIDVEGHEAAVFRGGRERLQRAKPMIVFESWHTPEAPDRMLEPMRVIESLGYRFFRLMGPAETAGSALPMLPLRIDERAAIGEALNIVAAHPERPDLWRPFRA